MYSLIHFDIADSEFDIPEKIKEISISNPDVEHHDAYASFMINGESKVCYMLNICTKPFKEPGDSYTNGYEIILVPIEKEDKDYYFIEQSQDYWSVFGENTKYITDPEECLADIFGYALIYGLNETMKYKNPEIIQGMIELISDSN